MEKADLVWSLSGVEKALEIVNVSQISFFSFFIDWKEYRSPILTRVLCFIIFHSGFFDTSTHQHPFSNTTIEPSHFSVWLDVWLVSPELRSRCA